MTRFHTFAAILMLGLFAVAGNSQSTGTVRGVVSDPSAAVVPGATVQFKGAGPVRSVKTDNQGRYNIAVPPGSYAVQANAKGFVIFSQQDVAVTAGQPSQLDIALQIAAETQQVQVNEEASGQVSTDPSQNTGAVVLKAADLEALPDDPDDLQADLQALAGPAAGPNGAQFFVDGFSGGQLPPKSSIREIRINSNPFSGEYDRPGFGRIEILTKPGTDSFHGSAFANYGDRVLDTRNPFLATEPGYSTKILGLNFGGPINKRTSFFIDFMRRQINENTLINGRVLDSSLNEVPYVSAYPTPNRFWLLNPRVDYQINANNTLVLRYMHLDSSNIGGVGGFNLPNESSKTTMKNNTVQATETMIIGTRAVDETRFQFNDSHSGQAGLGVSGIPVISVASSFTTGGASVISNYNFNRGYELQNILTLTQGTHTIKAGGRLRFNQIDSNSTSNFNGAYSFSLNTANGIPACLASYTNPTSLDLYRQTQLLLAQGLPIAAIEAQGCGPTQFTLNAGKTLETVSQFDLGMFVQDDWRIRQNLTLSGGLRYETQDNISDHHDFAPRLAVAWAPGAGAKTAGSKTVIRAGWGMFYDRFEATNVLQSLRFDGIQQQNYQLTATNTPLLYYPNIPPGTALTGSLTQQNIYRIDPTLRAPYMMQAAIGLERALPGRTSLSVNLVNSRGVHVLRTRDVNAPLPGTYTIPGTGVVPFSGYGPIYQYESTGIYKQTQAIVNMSTRFNRRFTLQGFYSLGFAHTNVNGLPMDQYNTSLDWGRAQFDTRHRAFIGGNITLPWGVSASPFVTMSSGAPFNITTGSQFNGDGIFNARPAFATSASNPLNVKTTPWGVFDLQPGPGATLIPVNYGQGPAQFTVNMRLSRTWAWGEKRSGDPNTGGGMGPGGPGGPGGGGPRGGGPGGPGGGGGFGGGMGGGPGGFFGGGGSAGKKYSLTASINARNALNHVNLGAPEGNLTSPFFGQSTSLAGGFGPFGGGNSAAGNRRIELQLRLSF